MVILVTRTGKGSALTTAEMDTNLTSLGAAVDTLVASSSAVFLTATQVDNTTAGVTTLTGHTWTVPPGKTIKIDGTLVCTAAAITTGFYYAATVAQGAGADGAALGNWFGYVNVNSAAAATGVSDGDVIAVAAGVSATNGVLSASTVAGNNAATISVLLQNTSTNADTTVTLVFRTEVAASDVTAQIGSGAVASIF